MNMANIVMNRRENIESIITKYLAGTASDAESRILFEWLKESKCNRTAYFSFKKIWLEANEFGYSEQFVEESLERLRLRTALLSDEPNKPFYHIRLNTKRLAVAATILVLICTTSFFAYRLSSLTGSISTPHEVSVPLGSRTNITLPDGTNVWLNAGSSLSYRSDFGIRNRSVSLIGEAYFNVQAGVGSVFTVNTRDLDIKVFGTQFNVKSYPDEDITETTLVSGLVEVSITEPGIRAEPLRLKPNQRIVYSRSKNEVLVETKDTDISGRVPAKVRPDAVAQASLSVSSVADTDEYTSWKDGRLIIRSESLENLRPKLERFFNVNITFLDDSIKSLKYSGTLEEVTIEEVMRAIARASNIQFTIDKNHITLSK